MILLELFAGSRVISKAFEKKGFKTYSVDWNKNLPDMDLYTDIEKLTKEDIKELCGGVSRYYMGKSRLYDIFSVCYIKT